MDKKMEEYFRKIINLIPSKNVINKDILEETPKRMVDFYKETFSGLLVDIDTLLINKIPTESKGIIVEKNIDFFSMCEHHFLPFFGKISIGYIPDENIVGFGDIVKVIEVFSKRPQLQERLVEEIGELIYNKLGCKGVCVHMEAQHLCMTMRGVKKPGTEIVTMYSKGVFEDVQMRNEFLNLIRR